MTILKGAGLSRLDLLRIRTKKTFEMLRRGLLMMEFLIRWDLSELMIASWLVTRLFLKTTITESCQNRLDWTREKTIFKVLLNQRYSKITTSMTSQLQQWALNLTLLKTRFHQVQTLINFSPMYTHPMRRAVLLLHLWLKANNQKMRGPTLSLLPTSRKSNCSLTQIRRCLRNPFRKTVPASIC